MQSNGNQAINQPGSPEAGKEQRRVTILGGLMNLLLAAVKLIAGFLGGSAVLVSDGVHSLSDLVSDAVVLLGVRLSSRPADDDHPYGHGRFETLASFILGLLLIATAVLLAVDGVEKLRQPGLTTPSGFVLWAALLSVVVKELLFRWTRAVARRTGSQLLEANAWHHRSDALSSMVALAAVGGAMIFPELALLDPLGSILVAAMIAVVGGKVIVNAARELTDEGVEEELSNQLKELVERVRGVEGVNRLCARRLGTDLLVDIAVGVDPEMNVFEAHKITDYIAAWLQKEFPQISRVFVHVEPTTEPEQLDSQRNSELREAIRSSCRSLIGVVDVGNLRLYRRASGVMVELDVVVDGQISVIEGHRVMHRVMRRLGELPGIESSMPHLTPQARLDELDD